MTSVTDIYEEYLRLLDERDDIIYLLEEAMSWIDFPPVNNLDNTLFVNFVERAQEVIMPDKKKETKEVEVEPTVGDDTKEAQPSIEREGAPIGSTGGGTSAPGESGGIGSAGNPG